MFVLKTAQAMYNFCTANNTGTGISVNWSLKHFDVVASQLTQDEQAIFCFIGLHNYISATKHDNYYAYAITNKRLLFGQSKMLGFDVKSVYLNNINDISLSKAFINDIVVIDTIKEVIRINVAAPSSPAFISAIHEAIQLATTPESSVSSSVSSADELKKYKELLDMGAITAGEYEAKKKQLLGL